MGPLGTLRPIVKTGAKRVGKDLDQFRPYLISLTMDIRAEHADDAPWRRTYACHGIHSPGGDPLHSATPSGVDGGNHTSHRVAHKYGNTVGSTHSNSNRGVGSDETIDPFERH